MMTALIIAMIVFLIIGISFTIYFYTESHKNSDSIENIQIDVLDVLEEENEILKETIKQLNKEMENYDPVRDKHIYRPVYIKDEYEEEIKND